MRGLWVLGVLAACQGEVDEDLDGFLVEDDCDDTDATVHPDATEIVEAAFAAGAGFEDADAREERGGGEAVVEHLQ